MPTGLEVTSANLRRWLEEEDLNALEGAVLEGYGDRVKVKVTTRWSLF